ncbi:hypothetical protein GCM10019059_43480 [Camelimonas fluminis]|uniref:DUF5681 domain-containing protein n=1 Tax=Camelimonas fluminis TaxID=1576911 RepID=A0ABV7UBZ7_9HYPH|nr:DUF5681 domain-containing protein [Camelimonas fluminis]GHE80556.1 hypothetical protein GCM10019059_43480 [Camelimonas fluminis]
MAANSTSFRKGQSGNPAGKPRGSRHRTTRAIDELLAGEAEKITRKAIEMACGGDTVALRPAPLPESRWTDGADLTDGLMNLSDADLASAVIAGTARCAT